MIGVRGLSSFLSKRLVKVGIYCLEIIENNLDKCQQLIFINVEGLYIIYFSVNSI